MNKINLYEITYNSDNVEGKGHTLSTGIAFNDYDSALAFVNSDHYKKYAVMGVINPRYSQYNIRRTETVVYDSMQDYNDNSAEATRLKALQKARKHLSKQELEILGLDNEQ